MNFRSEMLAIGRQGRNASRFEMLAICPDGPAQESLLEGYRRSKVSFPEKTADKNRATVNVDCG